ncbi:MAG: aminoacetone oxidase family FAD-binding enzyme [Clostridiales bacterium]|nr:MAG: aminoacetone oxidase family FAD-binding enzyme [Clostridiales bacterium]
MSYDLIIIGGGAAGMTAACMAAGRYGKSVLLLERNPRLGKKLLITGKGRCNITNNCDVNGLIANIPRNPRFLYSAFNNFSPQDTISFFESLGVPVKTERGNRVFPQSDRAYDVAAALEQELRRLKVKVRTERALRLLLEDGRVTGVRCESGVEYLAPSVLIATGGKSYPLTGSTGDGYELAKQAGHSVVPPVPSLIPILTEEKDVKDMQGLSLKNVTLTVSEKGKSIYSELGEMLFTHFGVSGPLILSASAHMREPDKGRYLMEIDLKPGLTEEQLDKRLLRDFSQNLNRDIINSLGALLPRKMIPVVLKRSGIPFETKIHEVTKEQRQTLLRAVKAFSLHPTGFRPIEEAIITSGGVDVKEVNPKTMESKLLEGLFFAGEVLDVDGYTGGFNLQIAFATAHLAALYA